MIKWWRRLRDKMRPPLNAPKPGLTLLDAMRDDRDRRDEVVAVLMSPNKLLDEVKFRPASIRWQGDGWVRMEYFKRWPDSKRAKWWRKRLVKIRSDKGLWRPDGRGYTDEKGGGPAWVLPMPEALEWTEHCGPEKRVMFMDCGRNPDA